MKSYISTLLALAILIPVSHVAALTPNDSFFDQQWYLQKIQAVSAWDSATGSPEVLVAILDTGIDLDHEDIRDQVFVNSGEIPHDGIDNDNNGYVDDISGWDFFDNDNNANPVSGANQEFGVHHGTVVAGVIGATGNNAIGIAGVNWNVSILPLRVLDSYGDGEVGNIVDALDYAVLMGADVINLSFVGDSNTRGLDQALQRAYDSGAVVVAAMGNVTDTGADLDRSPMYPVCSQGTGVDDVVIGVVSTDQDDRRSTFSNYGSECADISAPGESMYSTQVDGYRGGWSGTSLSTPIVSGAVAIIRSIYPNATPREIMLTLKLSVDPVVGRAPSGIPGALGSGRLNLARAIEMLPRLVADKSQVGGGAYEVILDEDASINVEAVNTGQSRALSMPFAVGAGVGDEPRVTVFGETGQRSSFLAYTQAFHGGVSVATGQVDGDDGYEVVTGAGPGGGPHVRVFNEIGALKYQFFAYSADFTGGVDIATGDVTGDGVDEIIVAPGLGYDPVVRIFTSSGILLKEILVDGSGSALRVSAGDVDDDGIKEIVVSKGEGSAPLVTVYKYNGSLFSSFMVYAQNMLKGVRTTVFSLDGAPRVVVGTDIGAGPHVRAFNRIGALSGQFFAFDQDTRDGVDVHAWSPSNGVQYIVASGMVNGSPVVRVFDQSGVLVGLNFQLTDYSSRVNL